MVEDREELPHLWDYGREHQQRKELMEYHKSIWCNIKGRNKDLIMSCISIDICEFLEFDYSHSVEIGNEILKIMYDAMVEIVGDQGRAFYTGADEFSIFLPNIHLDQTIDMATKISESVKSIELDNQIYSFSLYMGVAEKTIEMDSYIELLAKSHYRLHLAKEKGYGSIISTD